MKDIEKILITLQLIPDVSAFDQSLMLGERRYLVTQIPADLNAIRELELLVVQKVGRVKYGTELFRAIGIDAMSLFSFDSTLAVIGTTASDLSG